MTMNALNEIMVIKLNHIGEEVWRYAGRVLHRTANSIIIEAFFNRDDICLSGMYLKRGDRFLEIYYSDRWYSIFEIYGSSNKELKGWYCNITAPAVFLDNSITYRDLALDVLFFPDGKHMVLDEDEFIQLDLPAEEIQQAINAQQELINLFSAWPGFRLLEKNKPYR